MDNRELARKVVAEMNAGSPTGKYYERLIGESLERQDRAHQRRLMLWGTATVVAIGAAFWWLW